jgi:hypothetical protein
MRTEAETLVSMKIQRRVWGDLVTPTIKTLEKGGPSYRGGKTSPSEDMSFIYLSNRFELGAITHELLGHFYLATQGVPYAHKDSRSEFAYTPENAGKVQVEHKLTKEHKIRTETGDDFFEGRVWEFIRTHVERK